MKIISLTGHRNLTDKGYAELVEFLCIKIIREIPNVLISGAAIGADHAFLEAALKISSITQEPPIEVRIYEPFLDFEYKWTDVQKEYYWTLRNKADSVKIITQYFPQEYWEYAVAYQRRNMALVDDCTELWAYYDGRSKSGTKNCIEYANKVGKKVVNIYEEMK